MGATGCRTCVKFLLFFFNLIFGLAGCVILGISLWLLHDRKISSMLDLKYAGSEPPNTFYITVYILVAVGAVTMLVGFVGYYGAIKESRCLLGTFFAYLVVLFVCEIAAGIWVVIHKDRIAKDVFVFYDIVLHQGVQETAAEKKDAAAAILKVFHESLRCCGKADLSLDLTAWVTALCPKIGGVPISEDCHAKINELFHGKFYLIAIAFLVVAVILVFEMIFSIVLCGGI